jgi:hypothetical protein
LSDFFTPPPPRPKDPEPAPQQPPWFGPPTGTLPGTNTGGFAHDQDPLTGPVLHSGGGGGGGGGWHQDEWVWPLPPPGPVSFVCEWPAAGISLTRSEIDAQTILDAAARARTLFPGHSSSRSSGVSYGRPQTVSKRSTSSE